MSARLPAECAREISLDLPKKETRALRLRALFLLHFRRRRKLRLQRRRFRARQGCERRGDHVLRSRRLREIARPDDRRVARSRFTRASDISGEERRADFRRRGRRAKIQRLLATYVSDPPNEMLGSKSHGREEFRDRNNPRHRGRRDSEGENARSSNWRTRLASPSVVPGTEPKIKYYLFAQRGPNESKFAEQLSQIKTETQEHLESLWSWLQQDAHARLA